MTEKNQAGCKRVFSEIRNRDSCAFFVNSSPCCTKGSSNGELDEVDTETCLQIEEISLWIKTSVGTEMDFHACLPDTQRS